MTIILQAGDDLRRLAARHYGNWRLWRLIYDANLHLHESSRGISGEGWEELPEVAITLPVPPTSAVPDTGDCQALSLKHYGTEHFARIIDRANGGMPAATIPPLADIADLERARSCLI